MSDLHDLESNEPESASSANSAEHQSLQAWFATQTGEYVLEYTRKHLSRRYHFLGIWSEISPLSHRLIPALRKNMVVKSGSETVESSLNDSLDNTPENSLDDLQFDLKNVPFQADSLDGVLLHHAIHQVSKNDIEPVLEQFYHCLDGRGRVIIIAFSRAHVWNLPMKVWQWMKRRRLRKQGKKAGKQINDDSLQYSCVPQSTELGHRDIRRIKRAMKKVGFEAIESKAVFCRPYLLPAKLDKVNFFERLGRYFNTRVAPVVLIRASKEVIPLTPIGKVKKKEVVINGAAVGYNRVKQAKQPVPIKTVKAQKI